MHDDRSDEHGDSGGRPEEVFRTLKGRPTEELDSGTLWRRIESALEPRRASWSDRVAAALGLGGLQPATLRLAGVSAVALLVVGIVWLAPGLTAPELPVNDAAIGGTAALDSATAAAANAPAELVPLTEHSDGELAEPTRPADTRPAWVLDVRLVRGYNGRTPDDAMVSGGAGAGGADLLADLRGAAGLMPFEEIALVGRWQGEVATSGAGDGSVATIARLSDSFELSFAAQSAGMGLNLADVLLDGAGRPLVADELALRTGRPYLFGVQAEGEESTTGSLVLVVRLLPAGADGESSPSDDLPEPR